VKPAGAKQKLVAMMATLLAIPLFGTSAQQPTESAQPAATTTKPASVPKIWRSDATRHDFRVEITNDVFRADWVNIPPAVARQGAYIRTECRRTGSIYVGVSSINMPFAVPGAPSGRTRLCSVNVRFEVDSVSAQKITGHSETLRDFDVNACRVLETTWGEFAWVPKK